MDKLKYIKKSLQEISSIKKGLLTITAIIMVLESITPFINIYMSGLIIDNIAKEVEYIILIKNVAVTVSLNLFVYLILRLLNRIKNIYEFEFDNRYDMKLNHKAMEMDYADVENPEVHRMREKIKEYRNVSGSGIWLLFNCFQTIIKSVFTIIFSISLTITLFIHTSTIFSLILVIGILLNVLISIYTNKTSIKKLYDIMQNIIPFNRIFGYYFGDYVMSYNVGKDIRIYDQKAVIEEESMVLFNDVYDIFDDISSNQMKYSAIMQVSSIFINILIYLFVGLQALAGAFGVGSIVRYVGSINQFTNGIKDLMTSITKLFANNEAMKAYFDYMEIPSQVNHGSLPVEKRAFCDIGDNEYEIEFRDVSFKYPASETYVLRHVSIKFKIGERLALVGQNGSGKTTFIKLMCRLYDPTEGEILLNGIDIRKYDHEEYVSIFSVVFQDFNLFSFSLGQNVSTSVEYDNEEVEHCLEKAGFKDRYDTMQDGTDTFLYRDFNENGVEISGGEAQKVALARALYKDAPFVILDEPTAALDPVAEYDIYSRFNEIVNDKTVIYISHRLSSCRFCDNIVVLHGGELIQHGSHDTLISDTDGKYHELWNAQAQYYSVII